MDEAELTSSGYSAVIQARLGTTPILHHTMLQLALMISAQYTYGTPAAAVTVTQLQVEISDQINSVIPPQLMWMKDMSENLFMQVS